MVKSSRSWLLLSYKVPAEPARKRIALWRKVKALGAVYIQNGVCLLPRSDENVRRLKMLENEIGEMGGEAVLLESAGFDAVQDQRVVQRFNNDRDEQYREFLGRCADFKSEIEQETSNQHFSYAELEEIDEDLQKLRTWLAKIKHIDFYGSPLSLEADQSYESCEKALDTFSRLVFEAVEANQGA